MSRTVVLTATVVLALVAGCMTALVVAVVKPAEAAFPGTNGKIAFGSSTYNSATGSPDDVEIYTAYPDGTGLLRLTDNSFQDQSPAWSPAGTRIAFTSRRFGDWDVYTMSPSGTGLRNVTKNSKPLHELDPAWAPNGKRIAYRRYDGSSGTTDIYARNLDGTGLKRLTETGLNLSPAWSPDGGKIAYLHRQSDNTDYELWVMEADGTGERPLVGSLPQDCGAVQPDWSPDGSRLAFSYQCSGASDIYVVNADGTGLRQLTYDGTSEDPAWSPDGTKMAFTRVEGRFYDVFVMDADGSDPVDITNTPETNEGGLSWQPKTTP